MTQVATDNLNLLRLKTADKINKINSADASESGRVSAHPSKHQIAKMTVLGKHMAPYGGDCNKMSDNSSDCA